MKNVLLFVLSLFGAILLGSLLSGDPAAIGIVTAGLIYLAWRTLIRRFNK
jgi:hypothetical protein